MSSTDCLVLKVMEVMTKDKSVDNILYIFYDINENQFFIRGKRINEGVIFNSYSFVCDDDSSVEKFVDVITSDESDVIFELINYKNLQYDSPDITFEYLDKNSTPLNQIVAFYPSEYDSRKLLKMLSVIKTMYNYY